MNLGGAIGMIPIALSVWIDVLVGNTGSTTA